MDSVVRRCKKCGCGNISGPHYTDDVARDMYGISSGNNEGLRYRCTQCGYSWTTKCADALDRAADKAQKGGA